MDGPEEILDGTVEIPADYVSVFEEDVLDHDYTLAISGPGLTVEYEISEELYEEIKDDWG